jgi:hypothetical protein
MAALVAAIDRLQLCSYPNFPGIRLVILCGSSPCSTVMIVRALVAASPIKEITGICAAVYRTGEVWCVLSCFKRWCGLLAHQR